MSSDNHGTESVRLVSPAKNERIGKVLMLHGWAQNAWVFKNKSGGLTRYAIHADEASGTYRSEPHALFFFVEN